MRRRRCRPGRMIRLRTIDWVRHTGLREEQLGLPLRNVLDVVHVA